MMGGKILITLCAKKPHFAEDLRFVTVLAEAAIAVLDISGGENNTISHLVEVAVIAAVMADDARGVFFTQLLMNL